MDSGNSTSWKPLRRLRDRSPVAGDASDADFNCDDSVDGADLGTLLAAWGDCPS
jgi:hypothetical protein